MKELLQQIYHYWKNIMDNKHRGQFLIRICVLVVLYMLIAYLYDLVHEDEISKAVNNKPYLVIQIKSETVVRILLSIIMIIVANLFYSYFVKPTINQKHL